MSRLLAGGGRESGCGAEGRARRRRSGAGTLGRRRGVRAPVRGAGGGGAAPGSPGGVSSEPFSRILRDFPADAVSSGARETRFAATSVEEGAASPFLTLCCGSRIDEALREEARPGHVEWTGEQGQVTQTGPQDGEDPPPCCSEGGHSGQEPEAELWSPAGRMTSRRPAVTGLELREFGLHPEGTISMDLPAEVQPPLHSLQLRLSTVPPSGASPIRVKLLALSVDITLAGGMSLRETPSWRVPINGSSPELASSSWVSPGLSWAVPSDGAVSSGMVTRSRILKLVPSFRGWLPH
ncbi:hypothetical protein R6Z07_008054 [Ovis aries]